MYNNLFVDNVKWKAVGYTRLSIDDKEQDVSNSIVNQEKIITKHIEKFDDIELLDFYNDDGFTGTNFNRPSFKKMLLKLENGDYNCVVVKDLSRFGRESTNVCIYLQEKFPNLGIRFLSVKELIDSYKQHERMSSIEIPVISVLNESYASDTSRKTKLSLNANRKNGNFVGCLPPYGYLRSNENKYKLVIDENVHQNVIDIYKMYLNGNSMRSISDALNEKKILSPRAYFVKNGILKLHKNANRTTYFKWSTAPVFTILNNQMYTGDMVQGKSTSYSYKNKTPIKLPKDKWAIVNDTHEPIISRKEFQDAQTLLEKNRKPQTKRNKEPSIFAGFLYCGDCGKPMIRHSQKHNGVNYRSFRCSTNKNCGKSVCSSHIIKEETIKNIVLFTIKSHAVTLEDTNSVVQKMTMSKKVAKSIAFFESRIRKHEDCIEENNMIIDSLYRDYLKELFSETEYKAMHKRAVENKNKAEKLITMINDKISRMSNVHQEHSQMIQRFICYNDIEDLTRSIVVALIDRITIHEEKNINITFKYENQMKIYHSIFANG